MIVCLCEGVSDRRVRETINTGAKDIKCIGDECGAGTGCGMCRPQLRRMLKEAANNGHHRPTSTQRADKSAR